MTGRNDPGPQPPREALFWEPRTDGRVRCTLCPHYCVVREGRRGVCGVRDVRNGRMRTLVYGNPIACHVDPIEKKPVFHFFPATRSFSIATVGCNMHCTFCQNAAISQIAKDIDGIMTIERFLPAEIVRFAQANDCASISYTYTEPTIFFEYALDTARLARREGLKNIFVSNGYITAGAIDMIAPVLDAINIDLKSFSDTTYKSVMGAPLKPTLEAIRRYHSHGIWIEITTLFIPGLNDSETEMKQIADFIVDVDRMIPWHVSRFHPDFKMTDRTATPEAIIQTACDIGRDAGLAFVYAGNLFGSRDENTLCPSCGTLLIERRGFRLLSNRLVGGACPVCGFNIPGMFDVAGKSNKEA